MFALYAFDDIAKIKQKCFSFKEKCAAGRNSENKIDLPTICKIKQVHHKIYSCVSIFQAFLAGVLQTVRRQAIVYFKKDSLYNSNLDIICILLCHRRATQRLV